VTVHVERRQLAPRAPRSAQHTGVSNDLILQLVIKSLHLAGELSGVELSKRLGVPFGVLEPSIDVLKREHHCEVVGGAILGAPSYKYRITDAGRKRAALFLDHNQYAGEVPSTSPICGGLPVSRSSRSAAKR
jgi:hypothetical protein